MIKIKFILEKTYVVFLEGLRKEVVQIVRLRENQILEKTKLNGNKLFKGKGCSHCRNTGYHGRTGIFELITMTKEIRGLVFDNANEGVIRQKVMNDGIATLRDSGIRKVLAGVTTIAEVLRSTVEDL